MQIEQTNGNITAADVTEAVGEGSPFDTNASKIRAMLRRGSLSTIQKHLDTMRAQRIAAAQPEDMTAAPKCGEALDAAWQVLWSAAQAKTLSRLEALAAERDGLAEQAAARAADIADLISNVDALDAKAQSAEAVLSASVEAAKADADAAQAIIKSQADALSAALAATAKAKGDAAHAAELAQRDAQIERQAYQQTIERLTQMLSESKALHIASATPTPTLTRKK